MFKVANVVYISSTEYTFKFDKREELGMVIPIWTEDYPIHQGWTSFYLELAEATDLAVLTEHLNDIRPSLLLFLWKLRHIEVSVDKIKRLYTRVDLPESITQLTLAQGGEKSVTTDYLIVKRTTATFIEEPKREGVTESEIVLAFPVTAKRTPIIEDQSVHAFLPIRAYPIPVSDELCAYYSVSLSCFATVHYTSRLSSGRKPGGHPSEFQMEPHPA